MVIERGLMSQLSGGYFIRGVLPVHPWPNRRAGTTDNNRENINPATGRVVEPTRQGRSPLPDWYPRAPLRDITVLMEAIERREQRRAAIAAQHLDPTTVSVEESSTVPEQQTPEPTTHIAPVVTPTLPTFTPKPEQEEYVNNLSESIEQLEKIVMQNMKKDDSKRTRALKRDVQRKTLLSMR